MLPGLCYNGGMQLYRLLGYWSFEVEASGVARWSNANPAVTGAYPFVPRGIDEDVFNSFMRYIIRVAYFSFGQAGWELSPWWWWAQHEINGTGQARSWYKWMPQDVEAAQSLFENAGVRVLSNPTFGPELLTSVEPSTILAMYKERVWLYRQEWYGRTGYNRFEEVGPLGDIAMWNSRESRWPKGWPDRVCFGLRYYDLIEDVPLITARYWTKAAVIYLGQGEKGREGVYYLRRADEWRADLRSPSTAWMGW